MKTIGTWIAIVVVMSASPALLAEDASAEFEKGYYKEQGERDLEGALRIYTGIVERHEADRAVVAKALLRMGLCFEKLGRLDEAKKAFQRIVTDFRDRAEPLAGARRALERLGGKGEEKDGKEGDSTDPPAGPAGDLEARMEKETISLDFADAPFKDVIAHIRTTKNLPLRVDPEVLEVLAKQDRRVNIHVVPLKLKQALSILTRFNGLDLAVGTREIFISWPGRVSEYRALLRLRKAMNKTVSADFLDTPLEDALAFFREVLGVDIVLDPTLSKKKRTLPVQLNVKDLPFKETLDLLLGLRDLSHGFLHGVVYIARPQDLERYRAKEWPEFRGPGPAENRAVRQVLEKKSVSLDFEDTPFEAVVGFLRHTAGLNIVVTPAVKEAAAGQKGKINLKVTDLPLEKAFRLILTPMGLTYRLERGVLLIDVRPPAGSKPVEGAGGSGERSMSPAEKQLRSKLEMEKVSFDFRDARLEDVTAFIRATKNLNIALDPGVLRRFASEGRTVNLQIADLKLKSAIGILLKMLNLDSDVIHDVLYIASAKDLERYRAMKWPGAEPKGSAPSKTERKILDTLRVKSVSVDFSDTPLRAVVKFLSMVSGINMVIQSRVISGRGEDENMVRLKVDEVPMENTLRLMLMPLGLTYRIAHDALLVEVRGKGGSPNPFVGELAGKRGEVRNPALAKVLSVLRDETVTLNFSGASLGVVLGSIRALKGLNIVADPRALVDSQGRKRTVTFSLEDGSLRSALGVFLWATDLQCAFLHGVPYIARPEDLKVYMETRWFGDDREDIAAIRGSGILEALEKKEVDLVASGKPIGFLLDRLAESSGVEFHLSKGAKKARDYRVREIVVNSLPLETALRKILEPISLDFIPVPGGDPHRNARGTCHSPGEEP